VDGDIWRRGVERVLGAGDGLEKCDTGLGCPAVDDRDPGMGLFAETGPDQPRDDESGDTEPPEERSEEAGTLGVGHGTAGQSEMGG
jgi:hypothetical protein